jgi:hypothetical protein
MEEAIPSDSSAKQIHDTHTRSIPDVQENADFIMEHLNDPNFDLVHPPSFPAAIEEHQTRRDVRKDGNVENNFESALFNLSFRVLFSNYIIHAIASHHIPKCKQLYPVLTIP